MIPAVMIKPRLSLPGVWWAIRKFVKNLTERRGVSVTVTHPEPRRGGEVVEKHSPVSRYLVTGRAYRMHTDNEELDILFPYVSQCV
jgi:hypothetical protein